VTSVLVVLDRSNTDVYLTLGSLPAPGEKVLVESTRVVPGGVSGNFAANIAALGATTTAVGSQTTDELSELDLADLRSHGVRIVTDPGTAGPGFTCYILLGGGGERSILVGLPPDVDRMVEGVGNALDALGDETFDLAYLGVWSGQVAPFLDRLRARARVVATTLENAAWPADEADFPADAFGLVFCADETYDPHAETIERWQQRGGFTLVVTRGAEGSGHRLPGEDWVVAPAAESAAPIVDTSGAGDCFASAYCYGLLTGRSGRALLEEANSRACESIARFGARPPARP